MDEIRQFLKNLEIKIDKIYKVLCEEEEQEETAQELYIFNRSDLDRIHLRDFKYSLSNNSSLRQAAIARACLIHRPIDVLEHLYALWTVWENRNPIDYATKLKEDIIFMEEKYF